MNVIAQMDIGDIRMDVGDIWMDRDDFAIGLTGQRAPQPSLVAGSSALLWWLGVEAVADRTVCGAVDSLRGG